jgi:hypothetical protein
MQNNRNKNSQKFKIAGRFAGTLRGLNPGSDLLL